MRVEMIVGAAVVLAAGTNAEENLRRHGYSDAPAAGDHDGCPSGKASAGELFTNARRDRTADDAGGDDRTGWDFGFTSRAREERVLLAAARALGGGPASRGAHHGGDGIDARKILDGIDTSGPEGFGT